MTSSRPRPIPTLAALLVLGLAAHGARAYTLVLSSGERLEVQAAPVFAASGDARVTTPDGRRLLLPRAAVDRAASEAANRPAGKPSHVWTNRDLASLGSRRVSVLGTSDTGAEGSQAGTGSGPPPSAARDEAAWREQAAALRAKEQRLEAEAAQLDAADDSWQSYVRGTGSWTGVMASAAASKLSDIRARRAQVEAELQATRAAQSDLADRARQQDIPPGWLR